MLTYAPDLGRVPQRRMADRRIMVERVLEGLGEHLAATADRPDAPATRGLEA